MSEIGRAYVRRRSDYHRAATTILGNPESARDAVNDAFLTAIASSATFRAEGSLEGWIRTIVVNAACDRRRRERFERPSDEIPEPPRGGQTGEPEPSIDVCELRTRISDLPQRQRLIVFLRFYADLDYAQIADRLQISIGTVGATLHAALHALDPANIP